MPAVMSSPRRPMFFPGETAAIAVIELDAALTSTDSAGSTASLAGGIGAPVMMRTASPLASVPENGDPGNASPTTVSEIRLYGVAPSVESATTA